MRIAGVLIGGFSVLLGMGGGTFSIPFLSGVQLFDKKIDCISFRHRDFYWSYRDHWGYY